MSSGKDLVPVDGSGKGQIAYRIGPTTRTLPTTKRSAQLTIADVLSRSRGRKKALSLTDVVELSQRTGAKEHVTVETVFTETGHPFDYIGDYLDSDTISIGTLKVRLFEGPDRWFIACFPSGFRNVYHLVSTIHSTDTRWRQASRWISGSRGVIRPFLNHGDFERIGDSLATYGQVEVGRVSARSALDGSSDTRGWKAIEGHPRPSHTDVIDQLEGDGYSVRTLTLHVSESVSLHLRRTAGSTYYSGNFGIFDSTVLSPLAAAANERRDLLMGKQRRRRDAIHPVSIQLPQGQLQDSDSTESIIREVAALPNTTLAIFHRNPYLHLAMVDEVDGSNFDVMVTESSSIDVYPGYRATPAALSRLLDHLSDRFGGQNVSSRPEREYTLAELTLG